MAPDTPTGGRSGRELARRALMQAARRLIEPRVDLPLATWGLTRDEAGQLCLAGVRLGSLLERWGSPLHVVDLGVLTANTARFGARPGGGPGPCEVYLSYKTNPVPGVIRAVHAAGAGAEVVSAYGLWLALRLGVDPARIVFNGPAKTEDALALAVRSRIGLLNVNCRSEIAPLARIARSEGVRVPVGIRVEVPGRPPGQFGERIAGGEAMRAYEEALAAPELEVVAIHSHFNGEIADRGGLDAYLGALLDFEAQLRARLGLEIRILDVGGNLACPTVSRISGRSMRLAMSLGVEPRPRPPDSVLGIEEYVAQVRARVESHCAATGRPVPRIFLEPGRALTASAQMLLTRAIQVRDGGPDPWTWVVLDAGINVAECLRGEWHQIFPVAERPEERVLHRLTGPSCTLGDLLVPAWSLPRLRPGDALAVMDSGAYFVPFSTDFSFPRPGIAAVGPGGPRLLRRPATFEDLVRLDEEETAADEGEGNR
ncbi:MAG TPA: pyridoxal-dependent decarboxylase [Anaeromyxobacteraceae bacterium]|nr:pyridoxal-dependent decarboxylase [Anaeromyxobacteraceae bacterium]